jgi:hypothetical protein
MAHPSYLTILQAEAKTNMRFGALGKMRVERKLAGRAARSANARN